MTIFVSVAAYRDPDLGATLEDCVRNARRPGDLRFGVVWQHEAGEPRPSVPRRAKMSLVEVPWRDSRGACWARAEAMRLWQGEEFFLQIDSHHRFVPDWDEKLLRQAERAGTELPLLTTYAADFTPGQPLPDPAPTSMRYASFMREGVPLFDKDRRPDWSPDDPPVRARCLSAHLLFAPGRFVEDVPYDPDLYFFGEESTLAVRAFTCGYSLLHPTCHIMWHQNPRRTTPVHWTDHVRQHGVTMTARERDAEALARARRLLTEGHGGVFGCGTARTLAEYERYADVDFRRRRIGPSALRGEEPPPPPSASPHGEPRDWPVQLVLDRLALPPAALDRPAFWYLTFQDRDGTEVARQDADRHELHALLARPGREIVIERRVRSLRPPTRWTVWPADRRRTWLTPLSGTIDPLTADWTRV